MNGVFGPSLFDLVKERRKGELEGPSMLAADDEDAGLPLEDASGWQMTLKKKRRGMILKRMLADAGYGELAKMVNLKETT